MRRRELIKALIVSAAAWPLKARAQQPAARLWGFLHSAPATGLAHIVEAVREGIKASYPEGANLQIELRWAAGELGRLPALADELVRLRPAVIVTGGHAAALAAQKATKTIPIVFVTGGDPVRDGLVGSLSRPGSNATGLTLIAGELGTEAT